ncbi:MAG TPA: CHAD domain-containing protein [Candidatus Binatia bacterium]|nr:CHAD domain-containing protein [Candidatus Binatia bacterium]
MNATANSTGLRYWMLRVLEECDNAAADFRADPVHDLRVSLRRCRSMADGTIVMDPDREWKAMKKAGKALFQRLGDLRDVQIMMEWTDKLDVAVSPVIEATGRLRDAGTTIAELDEAAGAASVHDPAKALLQILRARETEHKQEARKALEEFNRKQWREWSDSLPQRAARIRPGSAVFKHLALERWTSARQLHATAMRNRSQVGFHTLRIGIKRFRYIVENFLPTEHKLWSNDLKHLQDLLGEVHDLDVLWATAVSCHIFHDETSRKMWHSRIAEERAQRIDEYRAMTVGPDSLWNLWRAGLPQGNQIQQIATQRMKLWAKALDPDFPHAERVARLALELYDGLHKGGLLPTTAEGSKSENGTSDEARSSLYIAALLHDVGKSKGNKGHHKESLELIKKHGTPLGWKAETMAQAAVVARFHCGALPTRSHKALRDKLPDEQKDIIRLAAVLRLANAFDSAHDGHIRHAKIENADFSKRRTNGFLRKPAPLGKNEALVISAEGYIEGTSTAQAIAAERYLLEIVLRRPVVVRRPQ